MSAPTPREMRRSGDLDAKGRAWLQMPKATFMRQVDRGKRKVGRPPLDRPAKAKRRLAAERRFMRQLELIEIQAILENLVAEGEMRRVGDRYQAIPQRRKRESGWSKDAIVAAIHRFHARYGRQPSAADFNPSQARTFGHDWRVERFYGDGDYPVVPTVQKYFGSWAAALEAAGFYTESGQYPRASGPEGMCGRHLESERRQP